MNKKSCLFDYFLAWAMALPIPQTMMPLDNVRICVFCFLGKWCPSPLFGTETLDSGQRHTCSLLWKMQFYTTHVKDQSCFLQGNWKDRYAGYKLQASEREEVMVIGGQFKSQSHIFGNISQKYTISAQCFRIGLNHFHFFQVKKDWIEKCSLPTTN